MSERPVNMAASASGRGAEAVVQRTEVAATDKLEIVIPARSGGDGEYALSITPERAG